LVVLKGKDLEPAGIPESKFNEITDFKKEKFDARKELGEEQWNWERDFQILRRKRAKYKAKNPDVSIAELDKMFGSEDKYIQKIEPKMEQKLNEKLKDDIPRHIELTKKQMETVRNDNNNDEGIDIDINETVEDSSNKEEKELEKTEEVLQNISPIPVKHGLISKEEYNKIEKEFEEKEKEKEKENEKEIVVHQPQLRISNKAEVTEDDAEEMQKLFGLNFNIMSDKKLETYRKSKDNIRASYTFKLAQQNDFEVRYSIPDPDRKGRPLFKKKLYEWNMRPQFMEEEIEKAQSAAIVKEKEYNNEKTKHDGNLIDWFNTEEYTKLVKELNDVQTKFHDLLLIAHLGIEDDVLNGMNPNWKAILASVMIFKNNNLIPFGIQQSDALSKVNR
jgi:hypothetical protein